tara:strand:+ start:105 stop:329 length:225 start_codon:yes stop_codon:yes gene_type:complete
MIVRIYFLFFFILLAHSFSSAQCAMCRIVAESSKDGGSSIADGLNSGILYLMSIPYILLLIAGIFSYLKDYKLP